MKSKNTKRTLGINDLIKVKREYKAGISIRALSIYWGIPYATLYRALKGRKQNEASPDSEKSQGK